jgi:hypothetical protein
MVIKPTPENGEVPDYGRIISSRKVELFSSAGKAGSEHRQRENVDAAAVMIN